MPEINNKLGIIGAGNMGEAFAGGIIRSNILPPSMIYVSDVSKERLNIVSKNYGINVINDNYTVFSESDIIILGAPHTAYKKLKLDFKSKVIVDIWNFFGRGGLF